MKDYIYIVTIKIIEKYVKKKKDGDHDNHLIF